MTPYRFTPLGCAGREPRRRDCRLPQRMRHARAPAGDIRFREWTTMLFIGRADVIPV